MDSVFVLERKQYNESQYKNKNHQLDTAEFADIWHHVRQFPGC